MKKIIILSILSIVFSSCRRNFATFQASHYEIFEQEKSLQSNISKETFKKEIDNSIYENQSKYDLNKVPIINFDDYKTIVNKKEKSKSFEIENHPQTELKNNTTTLNPQKIKKQNRRGRTWWDNINVRLKIGAVLLGIAVIFALLNIEILAIVFGLVAAYMIIRGLKKMW